MKLSGLFLAVWAAACLAASAGEVAFTTKPSAAKDGDKVKIAFTSSAPTDVEVAILDAKGVVVRHLAAGLLGNNAPEPFKKDTLTQEIVWDSRDDAGAPVSGGPFKVRVSLGMKPRLEKHAGWDGNTLAFDIVGLAVGKHGEVFVLESDIGEGLASLRVLGRDGKYLRTIVPYPADTPRKRTDPIGTIEVEGERIPIVFNGHSGSLLPMISGLKHQRLLLDAKGNLVMVSAVGTKSEQGPPRHLMALHPQGGAAEGRSFIGPQLRKPLGKVGGPGERGSRYFDHLAMSPDGEHIYWVPTSLDAKKPRQALYRFKWTDKDPGAPFLGKEGQAGSGDDQFNNPQGVDTDARGNLYVCDRDNNRVMLFAPDGKFVGKFPVEKAEQICVHPQSGEMYVLSRGPDAKRATLWSERASLRKFAPWDKDQGETRELARLDGRNFGIMALDAEASPPLIWMALSTTPEEPARLIRIADAGGKLEPGDPVTNMNGLRMPLWVAADAPRNRVLIREAHSWKNLATIDLASGKLGSMPLPGLDMAVDGAGNIYVSDDVPETGKSATFSRYTPDGKLLPFAATGGKLSVGVIRAYGGIKGVRGHCVAPNGDLYMLRSCYSAAIGGVGGNVGAVVDQYGADGKPKKTPALNNIGYGDCGLGVDAAGNIYVGSNLKRKEQPIPEPLAGKVPAEPWLYWRKPREGVWNYPYYNPCLFHLGAVLKFGPEGGTFYGMKIPDAPPGTGLTLADAPAGAVSLQSGYLAFEVKVTGMKWRWGGYGFVPTSDTNWGDPSCVCVTSRLAVDEYGRVFAPAAFLYGVQVLDTNGNPICRIGRYGNADSAGPGSRVPEPEIAFAWPALVSISGARVFVVDRNNRRVTVVKFDHAAEETCEIK